MQKVRLSVYLESDTLKALEAFAEARGKPKSMVAEAAIASFL
jgi:predicted transcriptional regulator